MENVVNVGFSLSAETDPLLATQWIRLTQITVPDVATKSELAALIDRVYGVSPCSVSASDAEAPTPSVWDSTAGKTDLFAPSTEPPVTKDEFNTIVQQNFSMPICDMFEDGSYRTRVQVVMDNPLGNYTLRLTNGKVDGKASVIREIITYTITVEEEVGTILDYPVVPDPRVVPRFEWINPPVSKTNGVVDLEIEVAGGVLNWGEKVTGSVQVQYMTQYYEVPVLVFPLLNGDRGESDCIGFYEGLEHDITLEPPDYEEPEDPATVYDYCPNAGEAPGGGSVTVNKGTATCYYMEKKEYFCECSGKSWGYGPEEKVNVTCPDGKGKCSTSSDCEKNLGNRIIDGGYTDKCNERDEYNTKEFYEEECCFPPPLDPPLPKCKERKTSSGGGVGLTQETIDSYKNSYKNVTFVGVRPEEGCGDITYRQQIPQRVCCDFVQEITLNEEESISVIDDWDSGIIYTGSGKWPKKWKALSEGVYFDNARTVKEVERYNDSIAIFTTEVCGVLNLTVEDGCSKLKIQIRATAGEWVGLSDEEVKDLGNMKLGASSIIAAGDNAHCDLYSVFVAYSGNLRVTQRYYHKSDDYGAVGYETGYDCELACGRVSPDVDMNDMLDRARAVAGEDGEGFQEGEPELINYKTAGNAIDPTGNSYYHWWWLKKYHQYGTGPVTEDEGWGAEKHCSFNTTYAPHARCYSDAWVLYPKSSGEYCLTYPTAEEWQC